MVFKEFVEYIKKNIGRVLPDELCVTHIGDQKILKTNDTELTALLIKGKDANVSPIIYLNNYYKRYLDGISLGKILQEIVEQISNSKVRESYEFDVERFYDFENIREKIVLSVVNAELNKQLLEDTPHTIKEDLAIIYKVLVSRDINNFATITVNNKYLDRWKVNADKLHECAVKNSSYLLPVTIQSMRTILCEMYSDEIIQGMELPEEMPGNEMYVISNEAKIGGAGAIFYSEALSELADKLGTDLYILPSSIHEVIAIPVNSLAPKELEEMVGEVNETQLMPEEILSNHVYRYNADTKEIKLLDTASECQKEGACLEEKMQRKTR